jgi:hypothetical protein
MLASMKRLTMPPIPHSNRFTPVYAVGWPINVPTLESLKTLTKTILKTSYHEFENVVKKLVMTKECNDTIGITLNKSMFAYLMNTFL